MSFNSTQNGQEVITHKSNRVMKERVAGQRYLNQELMREKMASRGHINYITKLDIALQGLAKDVGEAKNTKAKPHNIDTIIKKSLAQAKIIETRLGIQFRMLNKYLPDLKSVELFTQDGSNQTPEEIFTSALSRARISSKVIDAEPITEEQDG